MKYGYGRVSSKKQEDNNSIDVQRKTLIENGVLEENIYMDVFTGMKNDRPNLNILMSKLNTGDELIVTKLDRLSRSIKQGIELIDNLTNKGVTIKILNMGTLDNTMTGKLIRNIILSFAEFERDNIVERTQSAKVFLRSQGNFKEGRPKKYKDAIIVHSLSLLENHSYSQVEKMTGISRSSLYRAKKKARKNDD